jgi:hypothetical protein
MPFLSLFVIKRRQNSQYNDTQHNGLNCDTQNNSIHCRYAECRRTDRTLEPLRTLRDSSSFLCNQWPVL